MIRILAVLATLVALSSCATLGSAGKACVADPALASEVVADLEASDYVKRLEALATRVGLCIVNKTVQATIAPAGAQVDPVIIAHGQAWLAAHGAS